MKKIVLSSMVSIGIILTLSGCVATQPEPYKVRLNNNTNLSLDEKKEILNQTIKDYGNFTYEKSWGSKRSSAGGNAISYDGLNATFSHKFVINDSNELYRVDISREHHGSGVGKDVYDPLKDDEGFTEFINRFQNRLKPSLDTNFKEYSKFKKNYLSEKKSFDSKFKKIRTSLTDTTNVLPYKVKNYFLKSIEKFDNSKTLNAQTYFDYKDNYNSSKHKSLFRVSARTYKTKYGRFKVRYNDNSLDYYYKDFPLNANFKIVSVDYNFVPEKYYFNDKTLNVIVNDSTMTIVNKSNNFINIESISAYYNKDIETAKNINLNLPPQSEKVYNIRDFSYLRSSNQLINVKSKYQKVDFGFAISYYNQDLNKRKTLYKTKKYSINSF